MFLLIFAVHHQIIPQWFEFFGFLFQSDHKSKSHQIIKVREELI